MHLINGGGGLVVSTFLHIRPNINSHYTVTTKTIPLKEQEVVWVQFADQEIWKSSPMSRVLFWSTPNFLIITPG